RRADPSRPLRGAIRSAGPARTRASCARCCKGALVFSQRPAYDLNVGQREAEARPCVLQEERALLAVPRRRRRGCVDRKARRRIPAKQTLFLRSQVGGHRVSGRARWPITTLISKVRSWIGASRTRCR